MVQKRLGVKYFIFDSRAKSVWDDNIWLLINKNKNIFDSETVM